MSRVCHSFFRSSSPVHCRVLLPRAPHTTPPRRPATVTRDAHGPRRTPLAAPISRFMRPFPFNFLSHLAQPCRAYLERTRTALRPYCFAIGIRGLRNMRAHTFVAMPLSVSSPGRAQAELSPLAEHVNTSAPSCSSGAESPGSPAANGPCPPGRGRQGHSMPRPEGGTTLGAWNADQ